MVEKCQFDEIKQLAPLAAKARVSVSNTTGTRWFKVVAGDQIIGCGAVMKKKSPVGRIKGIFILEEYRGQQYGLKLTEELISYAKARFCKSFDLYTWHPEFWESIGCKKVGVNAHGAVRMIKKI